LEYGEPFRYRDWEPQLALGLSEWGMEKALRYEREVHSQGEFFSGEVV